MPRYGQQATNPAPSRGTRYGRRSYADAGAPQPALAPVAESTDEGTDYTIPAVLGTAALAGGAYLLHNPGAAQKIANKALDVRQVSMLSGLAPLKSFLGNVGGSLYESIERGSTAPIREMVSSQTARDAIQNFKRGPNYAKAGPALDVPWWNLPGRVMGAMDEAAQTALRRAGLSADDAERAMLQHPLTVTKNGGTLDDLGLRENGFAGTVGRYLVPFRRTPINQFGEGLKTLNADTLGKKAALATSIGTGAISGAEAEDPKSIAIGTAFSGRYGLPFAASAGVARYLSTGSKDKGAQVLSGLSPVSDYSMQEGVLGPVSATVPKPAAIGAYDYLTKLLGMK